MLGRRDGYRPCGRGWVGPGRRVVPARRPSPSGGAATGSVGRVSSISCARPGCQGKVAAWLTYDYGAQQLWIDDVPGASGDHWGLCQGHAARLRAPLGWSALDRRAGVAGAPPVTGAYPPAGMAGLAT